MVFSTCLAILMNCSPTTNAFQDDRVKHYVDNFITIGKQFNIPNLETKVRQTKISFGKLGKNHLGICYYNFNEIILSEKDWNRLSVENRDEVLVHELGHCVLNQMHNTLTGIMRPAGLYNPVYYKLNYKMLINELFECETGDCVDIKWNDNLYRSSYKERQVTFEEIKVLDKVILKFSAEWCPPCKTLAPIFDKVRNKYPEQNVFLIDINENSEIALKFGIKGIPTITVVKNGSVVKQISGVQPEEEIEKLFNE